MSGYLGDFEEDATVGFFFTTNDAAGGSVAPSSAFEAADLKIYKDGSATEKTSTNGVTMTSPFDGITGLHHVAIDTSNDTGDAGWWVTGSDFSVVLSPDETVDGQTVVSVLKDFSIENRGVAGAKAVWDRILTGATHNIATSAGKRLRQSTGIVMADGTAQGGGVNNITLAAGASATDGLYWQTYLAIVGGTGSGQGHHIVAYDGTTKVATTDDDWVVQPDATSEYIIYGSGSHEAIEEGTPTAVTNNTITLNSYSPTGDDQLVHLLISIVSGTGNRQVRRIIGYNGTTKVATIDRDWTTNPDTSSGYWIWQNDDIAHKTDRNADLIESQRGSHTWQGDVWHVGPTTGNDTTGNGSRDFPYATVTKAHAMAADNNHDLILLLADNPAGVTTLTEQVTISKNYLFIRGPGRDFYWDYNANGDVITITGAGVELSGFVLSTHTLGSGDAINVAGDFCRVHKVWIEYARQYGIYIANADWCQIHDNTIFNTGKDAASAGVYVFQSGAGTALHNKIFDNSIEDNTGAAIEVSGITEDVVIKHNNIHGSSTWGVLVGAGALTTGVYENVFSDNTSGDISDAGTDTYFQNNEQWAKNSTLANPRTEPGQGAPAVNPDLATKIDYLYKWVRNKKDNDGSTTNFYDDAGTTVDHKQTTSSAAGTVTKGEIESGP